MAVHTLRWSNGQLRIIDQTQLPTECREIALETVEQVWEAIKQLQVRGAPAIGCCAAFGVVVALDQHKPTTVERSLEVVREAADYLATSRPTAVNLFWALERMRSAAVNGGAALSVHAVRDHLLEEAQAILDEDKALCQRIGEHGAPLIEEGFGVLTHCNAGALATGGIGTALAPMFVAHEQGRRFQVYADETRPLLQGARLTAWELVEAGLDATLICDNMAAQVMREGRIQLVITGADRIAANGDAANKIGTYGVALLARAHDIRFYVAAPYSTFDMSLASGDDIPIEERDSGEVIRGFGRQTAPDQVQVYNPAFDVTPAKLIAGIITERGILSPPYEKSARIYAEP